MKSKVSRVVPTAVVLELSLDEANWLNRVMFSPLNNCHPHDEDSEDQANREELFRATNEAAELWRGGY